MTESGYVIVAWYFMGGMFAPCSPSSLNLESILLLLVNIVTVIFLLDSE